MKDQENKQNMRNLVKASRSRQAMFSTDSKEFQPPSSQSQIMQFMNIINHQNNATINTTVNSDVQPSQT